MFQITLFDVNKTSELVFIKKINIFNFAATSALSIFIKVCRRILSYEILKLKENGDKL